MFIEADPNRNADPVGFGKIRKFNTDTLILQSPFLSTSLELENNDFERQRESNLTTARRSCNQTWPS